MVLEGVWFGGEGAAHPPQANQMLKHSTTKEITRNYVPYRPFSEGHLKVHKRTLRQPKPKALHVCRKTAANKLQEKGPKASKSISERTRRNHRKPADQRTGRAKDQETTGPCTRG